MPNWVKTIIKFNGSKEDIQKIKDFVKSEESVFDFRKIVPYPTEKECPKKYYIDKSELGTMEGMSEFHCESHHIEVMKDYPYLDWYEWQWDNWGTKWNACEPDFGDYECWFDTAWNFCEPVIVELSKIFPNILMEFQYADEDIGSNCDYGWCKNGYITFAHLTGEAKVKFAIDIWGEEDYYEFKDGEWTYIDC